MLTTRETNYMAEIKHRLEMVYSFLSEKQFPVIENTPAWYSYLAGLKEILGNTSNAIGFVATLLAKQYLINRCGIENFDAADKPQGAPGLDIDIRLPDGQRLIAEIKTTSPYLPSDLGAQQKETFRKDFLKLAKENAYLKFFFLTEQSTFEMMKKSKYKSQLPGVFVVLLTTGEEFLA